MKSPYNFIVKPLKGRRYDNIKEIGGINFITSTSQEDFTASNRYAEVIETPISYDGEISPGDTLIVHHNVFKYYNDIKGRQKSGKSFLKDDLFLVDDYQFYMFKHDGVWNAVDMFCFVKPVDKIDDYYLKTPGKDQPLVGIVRYSNNRLRGLGVTEGDTISFLPDSEYEFNVDGEKLYRILSNSITIKLDV